MLRIRPLGAATTHTNYGTLAGLPSTFHSHLQDTEIHFWKSGSTAETKQITTDQLNKPFSNKGLMHTNSLLALRSLAVLWLKHGYVIIIPQGWAEDLSNHFQDFAQI